MPTYTVQVTVEIAAESQTQAYRAIEKAITRGWRDEEIVYIDAEVVATRDEDGPTDEPYDRAKEDGAA